ncbi:MAG: twin-arginine translocation signal domain-containing protein, partial [Candidatus Marinimicrobia bacterium]|nr:twin-arginine translocation signal domain-containing protein [Candidatus Neomarinimicrobiota bacterium]
MSDNDSNNSQINISRRNFLKTSLAVTAGLMASQSAHIYAQGSDTIKLGLVGTGSRGTGAVIDCFNSSEGHRAELTAVAELFTDRVESSLKKIREEGYGDKVKVTGDTTFYGFDAYKDLLETDVDIVMLATPPHFRPTMLRAAIEADKHVFAEKPFGVDPVGTRTIFDTADLADEKGLSIIVGTQQRRQYHYLEIMDRIRDGQIGEIRGGQIYWNWGFQDWHLNPRQPEWSDMEWQIRNWPYFVWLSGDHYVEQHFHNVDIMNWAMGGPPERAMGLGGRQSRTEEKYGNIWDHFTVELQYAGDKRVMSMASQINGTTSRVGERIVGAKGSTWTTRGEGNIEGENPWVFDGEMISGMEKEHADLIRSIIDDKPINEARRAAETNLTMIMGRISAYTGRAVQYSWIRDASKLDLSPESYEMGDM